VSKRLRGDTVDAGGISRGSSGKIRVVAFSAVQSHRRGVLKAASNAFVAEEQALGDVGPNTMLQAFKAASTHTSVRQAVPLIQDPGP
jgi:hypothetical protein